MLRENVKTFLSEHEDITTMVLSSAEFFNLIFKTPSEYGFEEKDIRQKYGPVWADHIHMTSRMHKLFAERVDEYLHGHQVSASPRLN
jgi:phospholipase/lecithinase/hemolysin